MNKNVQDWVEQYQADLKTARDNITLKNYYASVNFSQQAAEKALKSLFIQQFAKLPPKIHDLTELCRQVKAPPHVIEEASKLTITFFSSRYPGTQGKIPAKYYTQSKAQLHLKESEVIITWCKEQIQ